MRKLPPERGTGARRAPALRAIALFAVLALMLPAVANAQDATTLLLRGDDALDRGDYFEAVEAYRRALDRNPNFVDALVGLAEAFYRLEEYDQAQSTIDRARRLARRSPRVLNLSGLIAIGRGDLDAASAAFEQVIEIEPNNVDAAIGRAELELARGRSVAAAHALERALTLQPERRKALLSLVLIHEHLGDQEAAERYLEIARSVHRERPEVHVLAAEYHLRASDLDEAAGAARTAQAIDADNAAAARLRAEIALARESYLEAATIAEELIARDRGDILAWFIRAVASFRVGELETALTSVRTILRVDPENESARIWAEWVALRELDLDDPIRAELAAARADEGHTLERSFRYERALNAYQRALRLAPLDLTLRRTYAELFRRMGLNASYLQELTVIRDNEGSHESLDRTIDVFTSALSGSVARRWEVEQFTVNRTATPIGIYLAPDTTLRYPQSEASQLDFLVRTLQGVEGIDVADSGRVEGYAEAFARARESGVDFFLMVELTMSERRMVVDGELHVARTGSPAAAVRSVRSGPQNVAAAVDAFAAELRRVVPMRGRILRRTGSRVVIDLGRRDGVTVEDTFDIVDAGAVTVAADEPRLIFDASAFAGSMTVTAVDDLVAEARIEPAGLVDRVSLGDLVLPPPPEVEAGASTAQSDLFPLLYDRVRRLR